MTKKLMATVAFSGDFGVASADWPDIALDVDAAAGELWKAGFEVHWLPDNYRGRCADPLDDFLELRVDGSHDDEKHMVTIIDKVNAIVERHGGLCYECGPLEPGGTPFANLFD
jgi:hypothetical protein